MRWRTVHVTKKKLYKNCWKLSSVCTANAIHLYYLDRQTQKEYKNKIYTGNCYILQCNKYNCVVDGDYSDTHRTNIGKV